VALVEWMLVSGDGDAPGLVTDGSAAHLEGVVGVTSARNAFR
jgi:hypothetical protein